MMERGEEWMILFGVVVVIILILAAIGYWWGGWEVAP